MHALGIGGHKGGLLEELIQDIPKVRSRNTFIHLSATDRFCIEEQPFTSIPWGHGEANQYGLPD